MGYNTVAVLLNDYHIEWPEDVRKASRERDFGGAALSGYFGWGRLLSQDHASGHQVVVVHGNTGSRLGPSEPATQAELDALAMILRGHGYSVKRPGRARSEGPLCWGYAAEQAKKVAAV